MAPRELWGLDLGEIQWSKFKSSSMWTKEWHLRRTKLVLYQLPFIFCVLSESLGNALISAFRDQKSYLEKRGSTEHNGDFIGVAAFNVFCGVFVPTLWGAAYFFDLIWPGRHESKRVVRAWKICAVIATASELAVAIAMTIIVFTRSATIPPGPTHDQLLAEVQHKWPGTPLVYRKNGRAVAAAILTWPAFAFTIASTILLFIDKAHIAKYGPEAGHIRRAREGQEVKEIDTVDGNESREAVSQEEPAIAPTTTAAPVENANVAPQTDERHLQTTNTDGAGDRRQQPQQQPAELSGAPTIPPKSDKRVSQDVPVRSHRGRNSITSF